MLGPIFKHLELIEAWGTGIQKIAAALREYPEIEFGMHETGHSFQVQFRLQQPENAAVVASGEIRGEVGGEVTGEVVRLLLVLKRPMSRTELQAALELRGEENFRFRYLMPALEAQLVEMTIPAKPRSSKQRYRLTAKGQAVLRQLERG